MLDDAIIVYFDDILIYSMDVKSHKWALHIVFESLAKHKFYLYSENYALLLRSIKFLGHVANHEGVKL